MRPLNCGVMRSSVRLGIFRAVGAMLLALGIALSCFLAYWFWEIVLWLIFGPLAIGSLYAGWKMWRTSQATARAVVYWAASVLWVLVIVMISFKDVTFLGGAVAALVVAGAIGALYTFVQKSVASDTEVLS
jgi:hypothetical protein